MQMTGLFFPNISAMFRGNSLQLKIRYGNHLVLKESRKEAILTGI